MVLIELSSASGRENASDIKEILIQSTAAIEIELVLAQIDLEFSYSMAHRETRKGIPI
jgi:hypothetical protein